MSDSNKTKEQLIRELHELRKRLADTDAVSRAQPNLQNVSRQVCNEFCTKARAPTEDPFLLVGVWVATGTSVVTRLPSSELCEVKRRRLPGVERPSRRLTHRLGWTPAFKGVFRSESGFTG